MDPTAPLPAFVDDDLLATLAAGELDAAREASIRARAADDPVLAARLAAAERLEAALHGDGLEPVPLAVLSGVLEAVRRAPSWDAVPAARAAPLRRGAFVRAAAAALAVAAGAHLLFSGGDAEAAALRALDAVRAIPVPRALAPDLGAPDVPRALSDTVADTASAAARSLAPSVAGGAALVDGPPTVLLGAGGAVLALGLFLAARRARATAAAPLPPAPPRSPLG